MTSTRRQRISWTRGTLAALAAAGMAFAAFSLMDTDQLQQAREDAGRGATKNAVEHYLRYLADSPDDYTARLELAGMLKPVDGEAALTQLRKIPSSAPEYPEAIWHIAHIAVVGHQDLLAEDALQKLDKVRPNDAGVCLSLAELYCRTGRYSQALPWAEQATSLQPERALTWLLLAEILDHLKRSAEMLQPLRKAIELDPELYPAHANLAYALQFSGELQQAEAEARWCLNRQPEDIQVRRWVAMILRDRGEHDEAMNQIRRAVAESPTDVDCRIVEADLLLFRREAEEAYSALMPLYPGNAKRRDFLGSLARAAAMSGRRDESRRYQQEIVDLINGQTDELQPAPSAQEDPAD